MCILLTTNANKDYPFVLLSNRDEYFKRATQQVSFHRYADQEVLSPLDLARKDHGTWLALNKNNSKLAVLLNFREGIKLTVNPISRGVLSLDYITSKSNTKKEFLEELVQRYDDNDLLSKIGGFNLLFGDLSKNTFDIISNKNNSDFKLFTTKNEYHGLSNSSYDEPWEKVRLGEQKLRELTESYNTDNLSTKQELIDSCFDLLSTDTLGNLTQDYEGNFENIKNTIFVPPLLVRNFNRNNPLAGNYYGTRTQTVILVDKSGNLTYVEKNLHSSDNLNEEPKVIVHEFCLKK